MRAMRNVHRPGKSRFCLFCDRKRSTGGDLLDTQQGACLGTRPAVISMITRSSACDLSLLDEPIDGDTIHPKDYPGSPPCFVGAVDSRAEATAHELPLFIRQGPK